MRIETVGRGFRPWFARLNLDARPDNPNIDERDLAQLRVAQVDAFFRKLTGLVETPVTDDPPFLKRVRQRTRYPLWRLGHPYHPEVCVRLIVHFHGDTAVIALVGGDKLGISDQWYDSATRRAEQDLDTYYRFERNRND